MTDFEHKTVHEAAQRVIDKTMPGSTIDSFVAGAFFGRNLENADLYQLIQKAERDAVEAIEQQTWATERLALALEALQAISRGGENDLEAIRDFALGINMQLSQMKKPRLIDRGP